jgi:pilus assembly protein Flp/PilA
MMLSPLVSVLRDDAGATMVEYSLIVALIAIVCIAGVTALGGKVNNSLNTSSNSF